MIWTKIVRKIAMNPLWVRMNGHCGGTGAGTGHCY